MNYYKNSKESENLIKNFFSDDFDISKTDKFFNELHFQEVEKLFYVDFKLKTKEMYKMWGEFLFRNDFDSEYQTINLNSFNDYKNINYKKCIQLITYFHEATHKKQRDFFILNKDHNIAETSQYNNLLNLEIFCNLEAERGSYEQQLVELDAIHNSIMKYYLYLQNETIPTTEESLSVILYACVRYFASLNGAKHHTYCPEQYSTNCEKLINNHKKFYDNLVVQYSSYKKTLKQIIDDSEIISRQKKNELLNINFSEINEVLDKKTNDVSLIMKNIFSQIITTYNPSKSILKHLDIDKTQWLHSLEKNNIVKISALICDDLHSRYTSNPPLIIKTDEFKSKEVECAM